MPASSTTRSVRVRLQTDPEQTERLRLLQAEFAQACNALAPLVQNTSCWNRVALHHMAYRQLRQQFPGLGSQMVCNAIYSVSLTCRRVFQDRASPFNLQRLAGRPLPLLRFSPSSPVYFDRHTLSVKDGQASMYTLDGRMRFKMQLGPVDDQRFRTEKLREIVLLRQGEHFQLMFSFGVAAAAAEPTDPLPARLSARVKSAPDDRPPPSASGSDGPARAPGRLPPYVVVIKAPKAGRQDALASATAASPLNPLLAAAPDRGLPFVPDAPLQP